MEAVPVRCGVNAGFLDGASMRVHCKCAACASAGKDWSLAGFEIHCGRGASKSPKKSIRVAQPGQKGETLCAWLKQQQQQAAPPSPAPGAAPTGKEHAVTRQG